MNSKEIAEPVYRVVFLQQAEVFEIYARYIYPSDLYGFVEIEQLLFGERSQVVVDPGEERLKNTFADVKRTFIPMHAVIRIDEVSKEGTPTVTKTDGTTNISVFPGPGGGPAGRR
ncbi:MULTISPECIES: DUF1820 family protein [unclassified Oceanobacter]|jgi:hypothetical protein|uniref:DUF1820 family protein n=1 Tax=unclassified Oceanobacter TaxID=2620260 RepID=UPI0026E41B90|nr:MULTISPECIES: DUF1820 family protein [unclassified Oceanobacter]MDO6682247.1 DUF1820 family protein [Oceanobacter sp. 5_MG-2023]MDP2506320.1 DUF1820 family protein [Oceanobacter sp. 3_MG-2023]MDP2546419.1 DUF1820 family protein [Oceanobacter sp. 4_MG-2023]MDP2609980.1 DUF1820 family protein [Oceanobacter sp. 1_MG-2023]MDP2613250.1 DUF1820 family protein [Oceanobacter sp. 2_MG-2023]